MQSLAFLFFLMIYLWPYTQPTALNILTWLGFDTKSHCGVRMELPNLVLPLK